MLPKILKQHLKTVLAIIWFAFTFSLVTWWWIFFLMRTTSTETHKMFAWEGSILLAAILFGGIALIVFSYRDQLRHKRLLFFFATFSHDIKTSIARLRLQAEVLEEELHGQAHPVLKRLVNDILRLDLQLENSLQLANLEEGRPHLEDVTLTSLIASLRVEFPDISIELEKDAFIRGDRRALISVLRNLFQNSVQHGKASLVRIKAKAVSNSRLEIVIQDNGLGMKGSSAKLGSDILVSTDARGNGIGLLITKRLINKMGGEIQFISQDKEGFTSTLQVEGRL
jgi:signal transduction histidine kinase